MNLREFLNDWEHCPAYTNERIGKKQLWRCDYYLPDGVDYQHTNHVISTWDSYSTTICGLDTRLKVSNKVIVYVGAECTYTPTTRQHTSYIANELGFSYYDFKRALQSPCEVVATNDCYAVIYNPEQTLFNDKLNHSTACDLMHYYTHAATHGFLK